MNTEELLKPRYKVIADYPGSHLNVDEIIIPGIQPKFMEQYDLSQYPAIFKPLQWWEERKESDMPQYVKNHNGVYKVPKWGFEKRYGGWYFTNEHPHVGMNITTYDLKPATEQEYLTQKQPQ